MRSLAQNLNIAKLQASCWPATRSRPAPSRPAPSTAAKAMAAITWRLVEELYNTTRYMVLPLGISLPRLNWHVFLLPVTVN
jgi:hypothetical protein